MPSSTAVGPLTLETQSGYQNIISNLVAFLDSLEGMHRLQEYLTALYPTLPSHHSRLLAFLFSSHPSALHPFLLIVSKAQRTRLGRLEKPDPGRSKEGAGTKHEEGKLGRVSSNHCSITVLFQFSLRPCGWTSQPLLWAEGGAQTWSLHHTQTLHFLIILLSH